MTSELRSRLTVLIGLTFLGVGLAVIGTTIGATTPFISDSDASFVVSEDNITFEHGDQQASVVDNMSSVDSIEIEQQDSGTYQVNTETDDPLTESERRSAKNITRENGTVQQALKDLDRYNMTAEPIRKLTVDSTQATTITGLNNTSTESGTAEEKETFTISEDSNETGTVTIDRDPEYVEGEAAVNIRDGGTDEIYYSITVNLENETVTDITEWDTN